MVRTILLGLIVAIMWSSPQARNVTANGLRMAADWLEQKEEGLQKPKHFQIPNPFYVED